MRLCFLSLSLSLQDSMDEACAEGMANEHYRLEGRLPSCSSSSLSPLFILFLHEKPRKYSPQLHSRYSCGSFPLQSFIPPPPPPHLLLLHTHPLSPNNVLMRSPLPFTPSSPPPPPSRLSSAPPHPPLQRCSIPPCFLPPDVM